MSTASYQHKAEPVRRRVVAFLLTCVVQGLIVVMLFRLATAPRTPEIPSKPTTLDLLPEPEPEATRSKTETKAKPSGGGASPRSPAPVAPPAVPKPEAEPVSSAPPLALIPLSRAEFAASDIGSIPSARAAQGDSKDVAAATAADLTEGAETGPGGERLYSPDWYRGRGVTNAELRFYLPARMPRSGWAMIACRTIPGFRVDRCIELGQSPPGSGLSSALRQAAWQFRVKPPRIGGKFQVGAWVRIRMNLTERGVE